MNRLRAYRSIEGLTQEQLGELLGVSGPTVSGLEMGRREPTPEDMARIGYALQRVELPDMSAPLHRQRASTKAPVKARAQELLRLAGETFGELHKQTVGAPAMTLHRFPTPESDEQIEDMALEVRALLGLEGHGPIRNLTLAVENASVCLIPIAGLPGIDGLSSWVEGVPVIGVSPSVPGDRFRFTLAHELGHLLMHRKRTDDSENEAYRFAGALLFPEEDFREAMAKYPQLRDFVFLKAQWGMAISAQVRRAHTLQIIDDARYRSLQIQMGKWRKVEPGAFDPAYGQLFPRLLEANGGPDEVARLLGLNKDHIVDTVRWHHLRVA